MAINSPIIKTLEGDDVLSSESRPDLNQNFSNIKAVIDALIAAVEAQTSGQSLVVHLWNGSAYPARPAESVLANGLRLAIGPVPPGDNLGRDSWFETEA